MTKLHQCQAEGCQKLINLGLLMCLDHWRLVPAELQRQVWKHYRRGQEHDGKPSEDYLAAARAAVEAVAQVEQAQIVAQTVGTSPEEIQALAERATAFEVERDIFGNRKGEMEINDPVQYRTCISCGAALMFVRSPKGAWTPLSL